MATTTSTARPETAAAPSDAAVERAAVAFGASAAVAILFNTVLAWVKDAYEPLNDFMAMLTGHHWWTHGLFDLIVFFGLGWALLARGTKAQMTNGLVAGPSTAVVVAGAGLAAWFLFI